MNIERWNSFSATDATPHSKAHDALGQVKCFRIYCSDHTALADQQFDYAFDTIGNRKTASRDSRSGNYSANNLNQYASREVPGYVNILGSATNTATVSVNEKPTTRHREYFRAEVPVANSGGPVYLSVTNLAIQHDGSTPHLVTNITGHLFVPQTPEAFTYDLDGNLTSDGRWTYDWDGENRLVKLAAGTGAGPQISLQFDYDHQGRRIRQRVWNNQTWSGNPTNDVRYMYDGWNLLASLNSASSVRQAYLWGLDLSGSLWGAGGQAKRSAPFPAVRNSRANRRQS